jgi:hypothetical protein
MTSISQSIVLETTTPPSVLKLPVDLKLVSRLQNKKPKYTRSTRYSNQGAKAPDNLVRKQRRLGTSTFNTYTLLFMSGDSAATSSSRISLVSSTQRTLRPSHSVGFYITETFAAFGTTMDRALFELTFAKGCFP